MIRSESQPAASTPQACRCRHLTCILLVLAFAAALGIRVLRLDWPPLEFHPARQFMCAVVARGFYVEQHPDLPAVEIAAARENLANEHKLEPRIVETIANRLYLATGAERLWLPRLFSVLCWLGAGVILYRIALRLMSPGAAACALLVHLFVPFGILASRSFQPDPLMMVLFLGGVLLLLRHREQPGWGRLLAAAIVSGAAVFVKPVCLFGLTAVFLLLAIDWKQFWRLFRDCQMYAFALGLALPVAYYVYGILQPAASDLQFQARGSIMPALLLEAHYYRGCLTMVGRVIGLTGLGLALMAFFFYRRDLRYRQVVGGLWIGYCAMCAVFTYHAYTHDYYHLMLIPVAALSSGPLLAAWTSRFCQFAVTRPKTVLAGVVGVMILLGCLGGGGWFLARTAGVPKAYLKTGLRGAFAITGVPEKFVRYLLASRAQFEQEIATSREIGNLVGHSTRTLFLGFDGGTSLIYYGDFSGRRWPASDRIQQNRELGMPELSPEQRIVQLGRGVTPPFFVVTDLGDFARQADLMEYLNRTFSLHAATAGYRIYDLARPVSP